MMLRTVKHSHGQVALGLVFLVGGIIIVLGTSLAFLAFSFLNASTGFQSAQKAYFVANAGVEDTLMRLNRNKDYEFNGTVPVGDTTATVVVQKNTPSTGLTTITSRGSVSYVTRKVTAIVGVSDSTGEVSLVSWKLTI